MKHKYPDQICLKGMIFNAQIGVSEAEKEQAQPLEMDVVVFCAHLPAVKTDILAQTVDYAAVYDVVSRVVNETACNLLERLAGAIADHLLYTFHLAKAVEVTIRKPQAPVDGRFDFMAVKIYRDRSKT
jgi:7,8-dihydroneopterin aldolase/epimerase/oxygenase